MKVICFPSTTQNLAGTASICFVCAVATSVFAWFAATGDKILIVTPRSFAFCNAFLSASAFLVSPETVVIMLTVFSALFMVAARWLYKFPLPLTAPVRSAGSTRSIPCLCRRFKSPRTSLFLSVLSRSTCLSASSCIPFLTRSSTSEGGTAMYFIGFPSFIITKPFLSRLSRTS